jgi:hypothetical protein
LSLLLIRWISGRAIMDFERDKRKVAGQGASGFALVVPPERKSGFLHACGSLLDSTIRIIITVAACLLLIQLVDIFSLRIFGHGAW